MSTDRDIAALLDIAHAARLIVQFSGETNAADFANNALVQSAILHQLLVLGEATKRLSPDFRVQHGAMPWHLMARMRDRLNHGYDSVDYAIVWQTAPQDIPALLDQLAPLLPAQP